MLPATRRRWHSRLYPSRSWYSIKRPRRDARLSRPSWLVTSRPGCMFPQIPYGMWVPTAVKLVADCYTPFYFTFAFRDLNDILNRILFSAAFNVSLYSERQICSGYLQCYTNHLVGGTSNGRLLLGIWRDSLHVTCGLTACTPGSAPGPTLGNEYGKTLPLPFINMMLFTKQNKISKYLRQGSYENELLWTWSHVILLIPCHMW